MKENHNTSSRYLLKSLFCYARETVRQYCSLYTLLVVWATTQSFCRRYPTVRYYLVYLLPLIRQI